MRQARRQERKTPRSSGSCGDVTRTAGGHPRDASGMEDVPASARSLAIPQRPTYAPHRRGTARRRCGAKAEARSHRSDGPGDATRPNDGSAHTHRGASETTGGHVDANCDGVGSERFVPADDNSNDRQGRGPMTGTCESLPGWLSPRRCARVFVIPHLRPGAGTGEADENCSIQCYARAPISCVP